MVLFCFAIVNVKRNWDESTLALKYTECVRGEIENNRRVDDYETWLERKQNDKR